MAPKQIPLPDLSQQETRRRHWQQDAPGTWWTAGGRVEFNTMGVVRVGKLGTRLGLTDRPAKLLVVPNPDNTSLLMLPVKDHPQAVEIHYEKSRCFIDLADLFGYLDRFPLTGTREFHPVGYSKEEVTIDKITGVALEVPLTATETRWKKSKEKKKQATEQAAAAKQL